MIAFLGIDDGNNDTKSQNTVTPNGYTKHTVLPPFAKEYIFYNGNYYLPSESRFNYAEDKTKNERALIFALFGIAKELLFYVSKRNGDIQEEILKYDKVVMGAGLPPNHWKYAMAKKEYYQAYMKDGIQFEYSGYQYDFKLEFCKMFPQNYMALVTCTNNEIISTYEKYVGVDIGGGTCDVVYVENGVPSSICETDETGILFMCQRIESEVKRSYGINMTAGDIQNIILGKPSIIDDEVKAFILDMTQKWVNEEIIDKLVQHGVNFDTTPVVFMGGGALLLKDFIKKNPLIKKYSFIKNPVHANAKAYARLVKDIYYENKKRAKA